jgi:hypothetical protein
VQRFTQEDKDAAAKVEERKNAHLYCRVRIVTAANARAFGARIHPKLFERSEDNLLGKGRQNMDLFDYDASSCHTLAKVLKTDTLAATIPLILAAAAAEAAAEAAAKGPGTVAGAVVATTVNASQRRRFWYCVARDNRTVRPSTAVSAAQMEAPLGGDNDADDIILFMEEDAPPADDGSSVAAGGATARQATEGIAGDAPAPAAVSDATDEPPRKRFRFDCPEDRHALDEFYRSPAMQLLASVPPPVAVSCILCTVTYYANLAHNLTRSP